MRLRRLPLLGRLFGRRLSGPQYRDAVDGMVRKFRQFGLLADLDQPEFLRRFEQARRRPFDPDDRSDLPWLVAADANHVWMDDTEADVGAENQVYREFLQSLAAISGGAFDPQDITERWAADTGPITVAFTLAGVRHEVHPAHVDDWMDLEILASINALLPTHRYECWGLDQVALVVCLPRDAMASLVRSDLLPAECRCSWK